jgi:hypothetical protein
MDAEPDLARQLQPHEHHLASRPQTADVGARLTEISERLQQSLVDLDHAARQRRAALERAADRHGLELGSDEPPKPTPTA